MKTVPLVVWEVPCMNASRKLIDTTDTDMCLDNLKRIELPWWRIAVHRLQGIVDDELWTGPNLSFVQSLLLHWLLSPRTYSFSVLEKHREKVEAA